MYMYQAGIRQMLAASDRFRLGSGLLRHTYVGRELVKVIYDSDGVTVADMHNYGRVFQTWRSNWIQNTVGSNYLSPPEIPASSTKVLHCDGKVANGWSRIIEHYRVCHLIYLLFKHRRAAEFCNVYIMWRIWIAHCDQCMISEHAMTEMALNHSAWTNTQSVSNRLCVTSGNIVPDDNWEYLNDNIHI